MYRSSSDAFICRQFCLFPTKHAVPNRIIDLRFDGLGEADGLYTIEAWPAIHPHCMSSCSECTLVFTRLSYS